MKSWNPIRLLVCTLFVNLCLWPALAKDKKGSSGNTPESKETIGAFNLKVPVNVVLVSAIVTDNRGNPIRDLTREDFKIFEDGKPQPIHTFSRESYESTQKSGDKNPTVGGTTEEEKEGDQSHYIALMIDDLNAPDSASLFAAAEAIKKFLAENLQSLDFVSLASTSGRVMLPFTNNVEVLKEEASSLLSKLDRRPLMQPDGIPLLESQAMAIQKYLTPGSIRRPESNTIEAVQAYLRSGGCHFELLLPEIQLAIAEKIMYQRTEDQVLAIQNAADQLYSSASVVVSEADFRHRAMVNALRQYVRTLKHFEGRKSLVLFSEGFMAQSLRYELQEVVDTALRSNVIVNTVDIRGLYTVGLDASTPVYMTSMSGFTNRMPVEGLFEQIPWSPTKLVSSKVMTDSSQKSIQKDPLNQLAFETGGLFYENNNDLQKGIKQAVEQQLFNYILTYASPNDKSDGRYHKIKLEVLRPGVKVRYRQGYYAPREQISSERRKKEDILEAMRAPGNLNEIPIQLSYQFTQVSNSLYQVSLLTRVGVKGMDFLNQDARRKNSLSVIVVAYDEHDKWVEGIERVIDLNLQESSYASVLQYGFLSKVNFNLAPGRYKIRTVVRESVKSLMGSTSRLIEVP